MHIFQRFFHIHWHMKELNYYLWRILSFASPLFFRVNIFAAFSQHILFPWLVCVFSFVYLNPTSCNFLLWLQLTCSDWIRIQELRYLLILWSYRPYDFSLQYFVYWLGHVSYFLHCRRDSPLGFGNHLSLPFFSFLWTWFSERKNLYKTIRILEQWIGSFQLTCYAKVAFAFAWQLMLLLQIQVD
jgi:hypothetical protein